MPGNTLARRLLAGLTAGFLIVLGGVAPASPAAAADLPGGAYLFVGVGQQLAAIDRVTGDVIATAPLGGLANELFTGVANGTVYAAVNNTIVAVDASTVTVTRTITSSNANAVYISVLVSPDGTRLYALDGVTNVVDVFDPRSGAAISEIPILDEQPWDMAMTPDGSTIYVVYSGISASTGKTITVIGTAFPPGVVGTIPVSAPPEDVVFSPSGDRAYVAFTATAGGSQSTVAVFDTATRTRETTWGYTVAGFPVTLAVSPDGTRLFITHLSGETTGVLVDLDTTTGSVIHTLPTGQPQTSPPQVSADGGDVYIPEAGEDVLAVNTSTFATRTYPTSGPSTAVALVDLAVPVFESSAAATFVAGVPHTSGVVTQAFPRAALSVDGTLPTGVTFTDNGDGTGKFAGTATKPGTYSVTISAVNSVGLQTQAYTITVVPGPPAALLATAGEGQVAAPGGIFPTQLKATLRDGVGNAVAGGSVTFSIAPAGAASFAGVPSYTAPTQADGTVEAPFVFAGSTSGAVTVQATYAGLAPAVFHLTISSGTPPGAPTITAVTPGDASAQVAFTPGAAGGSPTTGYRVVATDTTDAARGGQTVEGTGSPITVPGLTNGDTYTFTVTALSTGGNSAPSAPSPPVVVGAPTNPPQPPTIESLGTGDGFVDVTFVPGAAGGSPTTGYLVTASDATDASRGGQTAQGTSSPIRVTGLTNADAYSFTVTALSAGGNSAPSLASSLINVGVPSVISGAPPNGTERVAYSFPFVVSGVPTPTLTVGGTLPPGLTLSAAGLLSGTPTTPGSYAFSILAANGVGQSSVSPTVVIGTGVGDEPTPTVPPPSPTTSPTTTPTPSPSSTDPGSPAGGSGSGYADSDGLSSSASAYLAGTGTSVLWPVAIAALLVVLGGAALWLSRRRRAGDAG